MVGEELSTVLEVRCPGSGCGETISYMVVGKVKASELTALRCRRCELAIEVAKLGREIFNPVERSSYTYAMVTGQEVKPPTWRDLLAKLVEWEAADRAVGGDDDG